MVVALVDVLLDLADGIMENHVQGIDNQDNTAYDLQDVNMVGDEIGHQRNAQPDKQAVEQVASRSAHSRKESGMTALVQGALNT